jgi:hypothetical protein
VIAAVGVGGVAGVDVGVAAICDGFVCLGERGVFLQKAFPREICWCEGEYNK